jgi:hypothetical protein
VLTPLRHVWPFDPDDDLRPGAGPEDADDLGRDLDPIIATHWGQFG